MNKILRYSGSKDKYLDKLNFIIDKSNKSIYVEPFIGSGVIFFNLEKEFDKYYINDIDANLCFIFETIKNNSYYDFIEFYNKVIKYYGDIKKNKESYYNFRNSFNEKLWKTKTKEEGFALILLYNSCINSMARWGPNGFNQSYGNRLYIPTENIWNDTNNRLQRSTITNLDFFDLIKFINEENNIDYCLIMCDPPYIERPTSYKTITNNWYINYIDFLNNTNNNIVYTDTEHDFLIDYNKIILREMRNTRPNRKEEYTNINEVIFTNIK